MTEPWAGLSDLSTLIGPRLLTLKDSDEPGAEHSRDCDYEWQLKVTEWGLRLDGLLTTLHNSPHQAYAEASTLRDEIVAAGFEEIYRCEVTAARVEDMEDHATLGWRGRIDWVSAVAAASWEGRFWWTSMTTASSGRCRSSPI